MPINIEYRGPADLPEIIPVFPLPGALLLPRGQMPLNIYEPRYLWMVDDAFPVDLEGVGLQEIRQRHQQRLAVDFVLAHPRGEVIGEGEEIDLALPVGGQHVELLEHPEASNACQFEDVAAVAGFGELGDAADAANAEQRRLV